MDLIDDYSVPAYWVVVQYLFVFSLYFIPFSFFTLLFNGFNFDSGLFVASFAGIFATWLLGQGVVRLLQI